MIFYLVCVLTMGYLQLGDQRINLPIQPSNNTIEPIIFDFLFRKSLQIIRIYNLY